MFLNKRVGVILLLLGWIAVMVSCLSKGKETELSEEPMYWALGDTLTYVGIQVCAGCHQDIYQTYTETGMGKSFGLANPQKSSGDFEKHHLLKDSHSGLQYKVFWKNDSLYLKEFYVEGKDTLHQLILAADFIIGSGQHTNSHIISINGYLFQMPFTFYTQDQKLDLPPGFEEGANSRFSRIIGLECMSCHNAMPTGFVKGSENKFEKVPLGIDCERCHGPGSAHVAKIARGDITDTALHADYSIVNPKKLEPQLRFEICQRCHLQGNAVLVEGSSFFDFKPGMYLNEVMDIYLPRYDGDHGFIMASHSDRLKQSKCFTQSLGKMDCTTCHNPHKSVKKTDPQIFNISCKNCHQGAQYDCKEKEDVLKLNGFNCVECHMPLTGADDIPHVSIHDHKIAVHKQKTKDEVMQIKTFIGLQAVNNSKPSLRSKINAYLNQYEKFESEPVYLDSLKMLFTLVADDTELWMERVNYFYLSSDYQGFAIWSRKFGTAQMKEKLTLMRYDNLHAWTAYKVASMVEALGNLDEALSFYNRAIELAPYMPQFRLKAGNVLSKLQRFDAAQKQYLMAITENPLDYESQGNLGFAYMMTGNIERAEYHLDKAIKANILYKNAHLNMIQFYIGLEDVKKAKAQTQKARLLFPDDAKIERAWEYLNP